MQVELGASVFGIDGKRLGEVAGLVVDAGTKRARALLVDEGFFDRAKHMVAISTVKRSDKDGLHLDAMEARTDTESPIEDSEEVTAADRQQPPTTFIGAAGVGGPVFVSSPTAPGDNPDGGSFFDVAPIDPPAVEVESNLGENEVSLDKGAEAVANDGHKLGNVVAFALGDMGLVDAITVSEGFILRARAEFSLADIGEFGSNVVHLRLTKAEAEAR